MYPFTNGYLRAFMQLHELERTQQPQRVASRQHRHRGRRELQVRVLARLEVLSLAL